MIRYFLILMSLFSAAALAEPSVQVSGAPEALTANIEAHFEGFELQPAGRKRDRQIDSKIQDAARALGYYSLQYSLSLDGDDLHIAVEPGRPVVWQQAQLELSGAASNLASVTAMAENTPFVVGEIINHKLYDDFKRRWLGQCRAEGFLDARYLQSRLLIETDHHRATAVLSLDSGPRYRVGSLAFTGSSLELDLLQRLSPIQPGDVFRRSQVNELRRNLENSRYFKLIDIQTVNQPDQRVDIAVVLTDASRHDIGLGLGYDTDSGVRTRLRWVLPRLNRFGHSLHNEATLSQPIQEILSSYRIPLDDPLVKSLNFSGSWDNRQVEDTRTTVTRIDARVIDTWWQHWITSWGAGWLLETSREGDEATVHSSYLLPSITFNHVIRYLLPDPVQGHSTWLNVAGSAQTLGAATEFVRLQAGYKRLVHLGGPHLLIGRLEAGIVITDDIAAVPLSQRFFTGGDQTVRGYELDSLAPRNEQGDLTGGQYLNVLSLEYSVRVLPSWRLGLFTDAGRAYTDASEPWHIGSGVGVRWLSPIGQIRIDVAWPVQDEFESGPRLHIFMGPLL